ncbi:hypothetical protein CEXT_788201 [Caerostris extrusa]|uniref:Uncharacterized protein n=1 Tax=Caerostris extrusa TaxID=172846 RepID=A0AAV4S5H3_CAEEX|nr:hypothetical protein CEXT_788201 [Caerostris extrusa]
MKPVLLADGHETQKKSKTYPPETQSSESRLKLYSRPFQIFIVGIFFLASIANLEKESQDNLEDGRIFSKMVPKDNLKEGCIFSKMISKDNLEDGRIFFKNGSQGPIRGDYTLYPLLQTL